MKSATFASLGVDPKLRGAAEQVLEEGETLSSFVEQSIRDGAQRRQAQREFIARGLRARESARESKNDVPAAKVVARLEGMPAVVQCPAVDDRSNVARHVATGAPPMTDFLRF